MAKRVYVFGEVQLRLAASSDPVQDVIWLQSQLPDTVVAVWAEDDDLIIDTTLEFASEVCALLDNIGWTHPDE